MNKDEWEYKHNQAGISNSEIIYNEFHKFSKEASEKLRVKFDISKRQLGRLRRGDLTKDEKKMLRDDYEARKKELMDQGIEHASALAASELHLEYWGS